MNELLPVLLGSGLGIAIALTFRGRLRALLGAGAVAAVGAGTAVASGEYQLSSLYVLVDVAEAALGLAAGIAAAALLRAVFLRRRLPRVT